MPFVSVAVPTVALVTQSACNRLKMQAASTNDQRVPSAAPLPPATTQKALEQAVLLKKRQRFFLAAVAAANSALRWRNDWKERMWKLAKFAEALAGVGEEKARKSAAPIWVGHTHLVGCRCSC